MMRLKLPMLLAAAASLAISAPAAAQMDHSKMPGMKMPAKKPAAKKPAAKKKPVAKKAAAKKRAAKKPTAKKTAAKKPAQRKAPAKRRAAVPTADSHAGHDPSQASPQAAPVSDPHAGHDMSNMPSQQVPGTTMPPGHDMGGTASPSGTDLPAGNAPPPPVPTANAADTVYGTSAMQMGRHHLNEFHGGQKLYQVMANIAEVQFGKGATAFEWDAEGWYGGDINRLWVKSEGDGAFGRSLEKAEVQALYSRAIGPYFNLQGGIRYDFKPNPSRVYATIGIEGLAPSFFDVEGALFLSNKGEIMARVEGYYDQRITQRLILQPRVELNLAAQNSREIGVGAGLSDAEIGLRLRYDIRREFAPYVGVQYSRAFGDTRRFRRAEGDDLGGLSVVLGLRAWF